jgi:hypothetical protein
MPTIDIDQLLEETAEIACEDIELGGHLIDIDRLLEYTDDW